MVCKVTSLHSILICFNRTDSEFLEGTLQKQWRPVKYIWAVPLGLSGLFLIVLLMRVTVCMKLKHACDASGVQHSHTQFVHIVFMHLSWHPLANRARWLSARHRMVSEPGKNKRWQLSAHSNLRFPLNGLQPQPPTLRQEGKPVYFLPCFI